MRVLYVDIDSLRPDHLGCYGYDRDEHVDRLERTRGFVDVDWDEYLESAD